MATRTIFGSDAQRIRAGTTPTFSLDLVDEAGAPLTSLTTITGKLYDLVTGQVINGRNGFDLSGSFSAGHLAWPSTVLDTPILSTTREVEAHALLISWTWGSGKAGAHEVEHFVVRS